MSSTLPGAAGSNGSSSPEVRRPLNFFAPDTRWVIQLVTMFKPFLMGITILTKLCCESLTHCGDVCRRANASCSHGCPYSVSHVCFFWWCCCCRFVAGGNPADAAFQLRSLIKALHAAGIEVLLEVRACGAVVLQLYTASIYYFIYTPHQCHFVTVCVKECKLAGVVTYTQNVRRCIQQALGCCLRCGQADWGSGIIAQGVIKSW